VFGRISDNKDWIDLRAGYLYNVMLKADHSLWYDPNSNGTIDKFTPVEVIKTGKWNSFSTYNKHVLAIMSDCSLWAFGQNQNGEIGDGTYVNREKAVRIGKDTNWTQVSAGVGYSLGIKKDGSLWGWGDNSNCQLGSGKTVYHTMPEEILF
jgi:alpha-tubulin suppressor-like RCC1 family protein